MDGAVEGGFVGVGFWDEAKKSLTSWRHLSIVGADELLICWILVVVDVGLCLIAVDVIVELVDEGVVIELAGYQGKGAVDCVVLAGDVGDGHVPNHDGQQQADDGGHYLAAIGARLPLLQVQVFQNQRLDLVPFLLAHQCQNLYHHRPKRAQAIRGRVAAEIGALKRGKACAAYEKVGERYRNVLMVGSISAMCLAHWEMASNTLYLQLKQLIQGCDGSEGSVGSITRFCLMNRQCDDRRIITGCFQDLLAGSRLIETKIAAVKIMTHILLEDSQKHYIRSFSQRLCSFLEKEKYQIRQSEEAIKVFIDVLDLWRAKRVFCDLFYAKLVEKAGKDLMEKVKKQIDSSHFKKYSKSFLMMYRDIERVTGAKQAYRLNRLKKQAQAAYSSIFPEEATAKEVIDQITKPEQAQKLLSKANSLIKDYSQLLVGLIGSGEQLKTTLLSQLEVISLKETDLREDQETPSQLIVN